MAVPKRRKSRARRDHRRAHWKAKPPTLSLCSQCHEPMRPHRVCPNCGFYSHRQVIEVE